MKNLIHFLRDEEGASMAEYALLVGLIAVALVTVLTAFGGKIAGTFNAAGGQLPQSITQQ